MQHLELLIRLWRFFNDEAIETKRVEENISRTLEKDGISKEVRDVKDS